VKLFIDVQFNQNETLTVGTIYRSPLTENKSNEDFVSSFNPVLKIIEKSKAHAIIMGDLN